jgi:hypothetical protein
LRNGFLKNRHWIHGFADDSNFHHSYKFNKAPKKEEVAAARRAMVDTLSSDVSLVMEWGRQNRVDFNVNKTQTCRFSHKRTDLEVGLSSVMDGLRATSSLKMLGINVNDKMLWYDHVLGVTKNAAKRLGFLRRCKKYFSPKELAVIYKAYIRPLL